MIIDVRTLGKQELISTHTTLEECFRQGTARLDHSRRLLEIGPGIRPIILQFPPNLRVLVEPSSDYCNVLNRILGPRENVVVVNQDAIGFLKSLPDSSFDAIVLTDVIEHLEKKDGLELIKEVERVSSSTVAIFTPLGYMPQHFSSAEDTWGFNEAELQTHRSGWLPEDFGSEWIFHIVERCHLADDGEEFGAMWAIYQSQFSRKVDTTLAFSPSYEIDRDTAIFKFSHSKKEAEFLSNGYTRLIPKPSYKVEYGSNIFFEGVSLNHKPSRRFKLSLFSYIKLSYFSLAHLRKKKSLSFYNLDRIEKCIFKRGEGQ